MDVRQLIATAERVEAERQNGVFPAPVTEPVDEWQDDEDPDVRLGWQIRDRGTLEWALGRLGAIEAEKAAIEQAAADAIARVEKRKAALIERTERGCRFFRTTIAAYAEPHRAELLGGGKAKTANLLHGKIAWRSKGGRLAVVDKEALLAWLERQPVESGLFRLRVEPDMKALQDHFKRTNAIPPGMEFQLPEDVLHIEPELPEGALAKKGE